MKFLQSITMILPNGTAAIVDGAGTSLVPLQGDFDDLHARVEELERQRANLVCLLLARGFPLPPELVGLPAA